MVNKITCPHCGEKAGVKILYGMPASEAFQAEQRGELWLGGCCTSEGDPKSHCMKCGHNW